MSVVPVGCQLNRMLFLCYGRHDSVPYRDVSIHRLDESCRVSYPVPRKQDAGFVIVGPRVTRSRSPVGGRSTGTLSELLGPHLAHGVGYE